MNGKKFLYFITTIILVVGAISIVIFCYNNDYYFTAVVVAFLSLFISYYLFNYPNRLANENEKLIQAILNNDFSLSPNPNKFNPIGKLLHKLYTQSKTKNYQLTLYKQLYENWIV